MGFEKRVLNTVAEFLGTEDAAEFFSGTLFVNCDAAEAAKLQTEFFEKLRLVVLVSPQGADATEFAFDFIA